MTRRTFTGYKGVKYKAWVCRDRNLGRKGNGCQMRIIREGDLLDAICCELNWDQFDKEKFNESVRMVLISENGVEITRITQKEAS